MRRRLFRLCLSLPQYPHHSNEDGRRFKSKYDLTNRPDHILVQHPEQKIGHFSEFAHQGAKPSSKPSSVIPFTLFLSLREKEREMHICVYIYSMYIRGYICIYSVYICMYFLSLILLLGSQRKSLQYLDYILKIFVTFFLASSALTNKTIQTGNLNIFYITTEQKS